MVTLLTVATSFQKSQQALLLEEFGDRDLMFRQFREDEILEILADNRVKNGYYSGTIGKIINPELQGYAYLEYGTKEFFTQGHRVTFIEGDMPQNYYEVVTSTKVLDLLGVPHTLGVELPITYIQEESNQETTETFILSGYYESTRFFNFVERVVVSESYKNNHINNPVGLASVYLVNQKKITKQGKDIFTKIDPVEDNATLVVNPAYNMFNMESLDLIMLFMVVLLACFVLGTGYILINNLFTIFIQFDIKLYSQIKCLGAQQKQIKTLLRIQLLYLSLMGIPLGLLCGYVVSNILLPAVLSTYKGMVVYSNIYVYIGTAFFVFLCLLLSTRAPAKFCKKIPPVLLFSSAPTQKRKISHRIKQKTPISLWKLAKIESLSNKKKLIKVIASLSFMPIILWGVVTYIYGVDPNKYIQNYYASDFVVATNEYFIGNNNLPLEYNIVLDIEKHITIKEGSPSYLTEGSWRSYEESHDNLLVTKPFENYTQFDNNVFTVETENLEFEANIYSMGDFLLESYEVIEGELDIEKFNQGGYLIEIVSSEVSWMNEMGKRLPSSPQDKIDLYYADSFIDSYSIMATVKERSATELRSGPSVYVKELIIPLEQYKAIGQIGGTETHIMSYSFNVSTEQYDVAESYLQSIVASNPQISFESPKSYLENAEKEKVIYSLVGIFLSLLLGIIGLVNLASTTIVSIFSRREQLTNLRKIGMSKRQLNTSLYYESVIYLIGTIISFIIFGSLIVGVLLRVVILSGDFGTFQLQLTPSIVVLALYTVCSMVFTKLALHSMFKQKQ